ncbi:methanobactin export MATE transporter MbnM [Beggiatoa leptomitoformis]|uniref:Di-heme enzyme n=1 Tax=Beggiatoa leptomitoformis TaxID=288004 RepID=A0A2N9YBA8_9GAMM|nr:methanobactin export MATE transporter MbnM [Beggiatoa leptomitoformis]ALG66944.1 di-heme enzyme [Beggiatoa leptomitoformis]AUI67689.1 di-heme enzyme [Beggiatoa leptomitoformis]
MLRHFTLYLFLLFTLIACGGGSDGTSSTDTTTVEPITVTPFVWQLPTGFPTPKIPADNPISNAKVDLGRYLFYDRRLSINETISCASCHEQNKAFTDGKKTNVGALGEAHPRNSMSLTNVAYNSAFNWANPLLTTLHQQALVPMFAEFPVELGWSDKEGEILARLQEDALYKSKFVAAFPEETEPFTTGNVAKAIASFVSTLISGNSPYDKQIYQNQTTALSDAAKRGMELFFSERLECFHCHGGFNFTQSTNHTQSVFVELEFHNNGLYNIGGTGAYPENGRGLWELTFKAEDMGRFRAPTLRNIELTAPYMHDGSIASLNEVIDHYARGGRKIETGEYAGDGALNPYRSELLVGFVLSNSEREDLISYLKSLTDWTFICDTRFSDPFGNVARNSQCP